MRRTVKSHYHERNQAHGSDKLPRLRADARRNRDQIVMTAREIFAEHGPSAPLEDISQQAGVGIGTLYRHFPDRQSLLRAVVLDVLTRVAHEAGIALTEESDAFQALARYMHRALDLRIGVVMPALVSQISLEDAELNRMRVAVTTPVQQIIDNAQAKGMLRADVTFGDIGTLIIRLARPLPRDIPRDVDTHLAHRHLDLILAGLRANDGNSAAHLSGPALTLADLQAIAIHPEREVKG